MIDGIWYVPMGRNKAEDGFCIINQSEGWYDDLHKLLTNPKGRWALRHLDGRTKRDLILPREVITNEST